MKRKTFRILIELLGGTVLFIIALEVLQHIGLERREAVIIACLFSAVYLYRDNIKDALLLLWCKFKGVK